MAEICLTLTKIAETRNSTVSALSLSGEFLCFVLEDGFRASKIPGETRIPAGIYPLRKRTEGGFYVRYRSRFRHRFVPELIDVPGFTWILFHIGNFIADTRGCLLVCSGVKPQEGTGDWMGIGSTKAYLSFYQRLEALFNDGNTIVVDVGR